MSNLLESFPILNNTLKEKIGMNFYKRQFTYIINNEKRKLNLTPINEYENICYLDDEYGTWKPSIHDLDLEGKIEIKDKNALFEEINGIAEKTSTLGLAIMWYSKKSKQSKSEYLADIRYEEQKQNLKCEFKIHFPKGLLASELKFKVIIYLKNSKNKSSIYAQNSGTILGEFDEHYVMLEGNGSKFPIQIVEDEEMPLWDVSFYYNDIYEDLFDEDHVCLYLNKAHKDYKYIEMTEKNLLSPLMREILANFFLLFIQDVKDKGINIEEICNQECLGEQTLAQAVKYWVKALKIDYSTTMNLSKSIRKIINDI